MCLVRVRLLSDLLKQHVFLGWVDVGVVSSVLSVDNASVKFGGSCASLRE